MIKTTRPFTPDWVSPPGDTIADFLEERDWTQVQLAERLGYTTKHISQLINGKAPINEETAMKLERVLGSTAAFWLNREAQYRAALARIEEENRLKGWTSWLDQLPVKELMNQGVIPKCNLIAKNKPSLVKSYYIFSVWLRRTSGEVTMQVWKFSFVVLATNKVMLLLFLLGYVWVK